MVAIKFPSRRLGMVAKRLMLDPYFYCFCLNVTRYVYKIGFFVYFVNSEGRIAKEEDQD